MEDAGDDSGPGISAIDLPMIKEWHDSEKLTHEKEIMGVYISGHPLAKYEKEINASRVQP